MSAMAKTNTKKQKQQKPKDSIRRIITPHLIALGILVGIIALNYVSLSSSPSGLDSIGVALGYAIIIRFFELLIFIDIVWLVLRLLNAKSADKTPKTKKTPKIGVGDFLKTVLYVIIMWGSLYLCYNSATGFLRAWNSYHSLNDLVALANLLAAVLFGGLAGIALYELIKFIRSK